MSDSMNPDGKDARQSGAVSSDALGKLGSLLAQTRDREMDCDEFLDQVAAYVDGGLEGSELRELMAHHMVICPECEEEIEALQRALGLEPSGDDVVGG